ncbi:RNA-guided endonuclease InsQ/TnpB family protein [Gloeothece citriformis]|nr:RNA-guided endonuclease TnpB family protein [Gloeothece citriformis]
MATKRITFRLYPNKAQNDKLHYWRKLHCLLYNACVYHRKTEYKKFGKSVNYFDQQNCLPEFKKCWTEYLELGSHALQATVKRVDFAFQRFFKLKLGYPRFKSSRHYKGWTYPEQAGWKIESSGHHGFLNISKLGRIKIRGKARDWGIPNTCTIMFKQGKWFASITVECNPIRPTTNTGAIGLDFGLNHAVADSNENFIENPRFLKVAQEKIKKAAKKARRKRNPKRGVRASRRWKKAARKVGKIQSKVARQRQDWQHKVAVEIVSRNSFIATEKLTLKGMTKKAKKGSKRKKQKSGLNKSILDVGIGNLKALIKEKVTDAGGFYIEVPTTKVKPSQTCSNCGHQKKKTLAERIHVCERCNFTCNRDTNAAKVMLNYAKRGQELPSTDLESSTSVLCGSMRQVGAKKSQKHLSQRSGQM